MGIIACVEVTTTTTITPITITTPASPAPTTSGTTTIPTSVQTTTNCQRDMAQVGSVYVSSVIYSIQPLQGTNDADLTNTASNGVTFPQPLGTTGLFYQNNQPIYSLTLTFNPAGVNSLSSIVVNDASNVEQFSVEFFGLSNPNQLITYSTYLGAIPVSYNSTIINSQPSIVNFPADAPSDLSGILITILSTINNE